MQLPTAPAPLRSALLPTIACSCCCCSVSWCWNRDFNMPGVCFPFVSRTIISLYFFCVFDHFLLFWLFIVFTYLHSFLFFFCFSLCFFFSVSSVVACTLLRTTTHYTHLFNILLLLLCLPLWLAFFLCAFVWYLPVVILPVFYSQSLNAALFSIIFMLTSLFACCLNVYCFCFVAVFLRQTQ